MYINPDTASSAADCPPDLTVLACAVWSPDGARLAPTSSTSPRPSPSPRRDMLHDPLLDAATYNEHLNQAAPTAPELLAKTPAELSQPLRSNPTLRCEHGTVTEPQRQPAAPDHTVGGLIGQDGDLGSWSPNGHWILFGAHGQLYVVHPGGTDLHTITLAGVSSRSWPSAPAGRPTARNSCSRYSPAEHPKRAKKEGIYTANTNGTDVDQVTSTLPGQFDDTPDWGAHPLAR